MVIAIRKELKECVQSWQEIDERLTKILFMLAGHEMVVIAVYAPKDDSFQTIKDDFEVEL